MKKRVVILFAVVACAIAAPFVLRSCQYSDNRRPELGAEHSQESNTATPNATATPEVSAFGLFTPSTSSPEVTASTQATPTNTTHVPTTQKPASTPAFSVRINGKTVSVAGGVDEHTLDKSPGWLETSALPGQEGMCVIYGHRNRTHLRILETVEAGDSVTATMPDGTEYVYIITQVQAFEGRPCYPHAGRQVHRAHNLLPFSLLRQRAGQVFGGRAA